LLGFTLVQVLYAISIAGFGYSLLRSLREARAMKRVPEGTETVSL
jgi:hypothetical protein